MTILEEEVNITVTSGNMKHFENIGYEIPKIKNKQGMLRTPMGTQIRVKVHHLKEFSNVRLTKACDICGKHTPNQTYQIIIRQRNIGDGIDMCNKCRRETIHNKSIQNGNFLANTHPHIAELLANKEIGYEVSYNSTREENFQCLNCNYINKKKVYNVVKHGFSCPNCSDGNSYSEKIISNILIQLNITFVKEKVFKWSRKIESKNEKLNGTKKYDFYIPSLNCIIETHGRQHYDGSFEKLNGRNLYDEQENDRIKEKLAKENGINNYIVLDCRYSELDYIKKSIFSSKLVNLINLDKVNWIKCQESTFSTIVKDVCDLWNDGVRPSTKIGKTLGLSGTTVVKYLKRGSKLGWCNYDPKYERNNNENKKKKIIKLAINGEFIAEYESGRMASEESNISTSSISCVCSGKKLTAGGFIWMYKEDYENKGVLPYHKQTRAKPLIQLTIEGKYIKEWKSITYAVEELNIKGNASIIRVCQGNRMSAYGYKWMYKEDYDQYIKQSN